jgi:hypothetical protein
MKKTILFIVLAIAVLLVACSRTPKENIPPLAVQNQPKLDPVDIIFINDSDCPLCQHPAMLFGQLNSAGIKLGKLIVAEYNGTAGRNLTASYNISRVPAALISSRIIEYPGIGQNFLKSGAPVQGFYLLLSPPVYRDLKTGQIRGIVNLTVITDKTCLECSTNQTFRKAFGSLGVVPALEKDYDVSSTQGKALIAKYNITDVPAAILTGDLGVYGNFMSVWKEVGIVEPDGAYVFRNYEPLGAGVIYKELATGKEINQTLS